MQKVKVAVEELSKGAYVAELDRPWLESPFLFQGFYIRSDEELGQLRGLCRYVYIDAEAPPVEEAADGGAAHGPLSPALAVSEDATDTAIEPSAMERITEVRGNTRGYVERVLAAERLGEVLDADETRRVVADVVDAVSTNVNSAMWLANLEQQHADTATHSMNTCVLAVAFARYLGYSGEALENIGMGALLHDVGKLRVPLSVLEKPTRLSPAEREVIQQHPVDGYNVLRVTGGYPDEVLNIVRWHHERVSGSGYPDGLRGEDIPKEVLIASMADVYDEITGERVYSAGVPPHEGLNAMSRDAPHDFGGELMTEFIRCMGIYPIGSVVKLSSGVLAVVVGTNAHSRLRPMVMLLRDSHNQPIEARPLLNLATMSERGQDGQWMVAGPVNPQDYGIDINAELVAARGQ